MDPTSQLRAVLVQTMNPEMVARKQAEAYLESMEVQPGFAVFLLDYIRHSTRADASPEETMTSQSAAVHFKNVVKRRWCPKEQSTEDDPSRLRYASSKWYLTRAISVVRSLLFDFQNWVVVRYPKIGDCSRGPLSPTCKLKSLVSFYLPVIPTKFSDVSFIYKKNSPLLAPINDADKEAIKARMVTYMCTMPVAVQVLCEHRLINLSSSSFCC
jgi:hypothetical protein